MSSQENSPEFDRGSVLDSAVRETGTPSNMASDPLVGHSLLLDIDDGFTLPDLRGVAGTTVGEPAGAVRSAYFDTFDRRLSERGIILSRVTDGDAGGAVWTLAVSPHRAGGRDGTTTFTWIGERESLPPALASLLLGITRRERLDSVAELITERRRIVLYDRTGKPWGSIEDDSITVASGPSRGRHLRQLELSLQPNGTDMQGVLQQLRHAGARRPSKTRLLEVVGLPAAPSDGSGRLSKEATVGEVAVGVVADGYGQLVDHDLRMRFDPGRPSAHDVHQARVATRRLRSNLKTLKAVTDESWTDRIRGELEWLGALLGAVRDSDVLSRSLEPGERDGIDDDPGLDELRTTGLAELRRRQEEQRRSAARRLWAALSSDRYLDLLDDLHGFVHGSATDVAEACPHASDLWDAPAAPVLPKLVWRQWKALRKRVRKAGKNPTDGQLHRIRIGAKQLRYAAETSSPVLGKAASRTAKKAEQVQTILGEHHDAVSALKWLGAEAEDPPLAAATFWAGHLSADLERRRRQRARRWRAAWRELDRCKYRRWMA
jgi:CHAD domain-containing protein